MSLLSKLEAATEGSRELDLAIAGLKSVSVAVLRYPDGTHTAPHYTTSIDAALPALPEGRLVKLEWTEFGARAGLFDIDLVDGPYHSATAPTPALALITAIMKAREVG